jgi:hypothetical protein
VVFFDEVRESEHFDIIVRLNRHFTQNVQRSVRILKKGTSDGETQENLFFVVRLIFLFILLDQVAKVD